MRKAAGRSCWSGSRLDVFLDIEVFADVLLQERKILGCWYGSSDPARRRA
jgi:hypothetical protein